MKEWLKKRYIEGLQKVMPGCVVRDEVAEKYAERYLRRLGKRDYVQRAEVVRVDRQTLKSVRYPVFLPKDCTEEEVLKLARKAANVGDFLVFPDQKIYRRVRGGWREASEDEVAELLASQL